MEVRNAGLTGIMNHTEMTQLLQKGYFSFICFRLSPCDYTERLKERKSYQNCPSEVFPIFIIILHQGHCGTSFRRPEQIRIVQCEDYSTVCLSNTLIL